MKSGRNFQVCRSLPVDFVWFLADVLTSEATRKFSKGRRHILKVSRRCSYIRALQRTNFCDHTMSQSFFIEGKAMKTRFLMKSGRNFEVYQWILSRFWRMFWLQRPLENFLKVGDACSRYLEGAPTSGLHNALTPVIIRPQTHFLLKEKQQKHDFRWNQAEISKFVEVCQWILSSFWRMVWLQRPLENFLKVGDICARYLEGAPISGLYNAPTCVIIRPLTHFLLKEKQQKRDFRWNQAEISKFTDGFCLVFGGFWRMFWLQRPLENFLKVGDT